jgi:hypothetical protein
MRKPIYIIHPFKFKNKNGEYEAKGCRKEIKLAREQNHQTPIG